MIQLLQTVYHKYERLYCSLDLSAQPRKFALLILPKVVLDLRDALLNDFMVSRAKQVVELKQQLPHLALQIVLVIHEKLAGVKIPYKIRLKSRTFEHKSQVLVVERLGAASLVKRVEELFNFQTQALGNLLEIVVIKMKIKFFTIKRNLFSFQKGDFELFKHQLEHEFDVLFKPFGRYLPHEAHSPLKYLSYGDLTTEAS